MNIDKERLSRLADADPNIDRESFDSFIRDSYGVNLSPSKEVKVVKEEPNKFDPQVYRIKGATSRPGLGVSSLKREILQNRPTEHGDYWVNRTDRIPLETYKKMAVDPEIAFGIFLLKGWIGGLPYEIKCRDPEIKGVVEYVLKDIWGGLIRDMMDAMETGFSFGEKVWERQQTKVEKDGDDGDVETVFEGHLVGLKKVKFLDPEHSFRYFKKGDELSRVEQQQLRKTASVSRDKLVWFALDKKYSGIFGKSRLKNVYAAWYYSSVVDKYMMNDLQKRGSPHLEIRFPKGSSYIGEEKVPNNVVAEHIARKMMSDGIAVLPSETHDDGTPKWYIAYANTRQGESKSPYLEVLTHFAHKKMKGMGIPAPVADPDGDFAGADAGADLLMVVLEDIVNQLESSIQKELIDQIVDYNFHPEGRSQVELEIDKNALGRRELVKELLKTMLRTGTSMQGHTLKIWPDTSSMLNELGITGSAFKDAFMEIEGADREIGDTLIDEAEQDEDSNDQDVHRDEEDNRDRGRAVEQDNATDSST